MLSAVYKRTWHLPSVQVGSGVRKDRPADAYTTQWVQKAFEN